MGEDFPVHQFFAHDSHTIYPFDKSYKSTGILLEHMVVLGWEGVR
jgi:hypothetical protein